MATKDPITSHVLNTVTGRPAADMAVTLTLLSPGHKHQNVTFSARTDNDGRIAKWPAASTTTAETKSISIADVFAEGPTADSGGRLLWKAAYDVESFYGPGKTLFKVVELTVYMDVPNASTGDGGPGHLHVPLLLGPWSYTTYRGS